ncbi:Hemicentin-2 [Manis javanica]|nr:Hemicentin-2 [Manis javanica]
MSTLVTQMLIFVTTPVHRANPASATGAPLPSVLWTLVNAGQKAGFFSFLPPNTLLVTEVPPASWIQSPHLSRAIQCQGRRMAFPRQGPAQVNTLRFLGLRLCAV